MPPNRCRRFSALIAVAVALLLAAVAVPAAPASADVDDFSFSSWSARYELSLDSDGRARLRVQEHVVAEFPDYRQNKGIVRGLPTSYLGARLETKVLSVTDADGNAIAYETDDEDGELLVLTGTDEYVYGSNDYVITYEMRDVMFSPDDANIDEFQWNLLPVEGAQDIESVSIEIIIDPTLAAELTGERACYEGEYGSTDRCDLIGPVDTGDGTGFSVTSGMRAGGDGITVAIGFNPGTVTQPDYRLPNTMADVVPIVAGAGAIGLGVASFVAIGAHVRRRRTATGIMVVQYDVPPRMPPLLAAQVISETYRVIPAQLVHLAVRGNLRIEDRADQQPVLHRAEAPIGDPLDNEMLMALFPQPEQTSVEMPEQSADFGQRIHSVMVSSASEAKARGLIMQERIPKARTFFLVSLLFLAVAVGFTIYAIALGRVPGFGFVVTSIAVVLTVVTMILALSKHTVLTPAGAQQYEYLQGVREFIKTAEANRLQVLQSYSGAERYTQDGVELIHLYERLLPYAILFGMEKEWAEVLDARYRESGYGPQWMSGYSAATFAGSVAHVSQAASSSIESSSSGSSGGGFSGGGGGGGSVGGR